MEGCRARRNPISCGLKASGPYHFRARIETFQVLAATFPADLQMTADAIRAARRISGKRRIPRGPRRLRDPISCGSKPPGPYHFRARNQSFQGFAAPFPANALLLSVRCAPTILASPPARKSNARFSRPGFACGGPTERGEGRLRAKRTIRRSPFGAAALRTDIEQNRRPVKKLIVFLEDGEAPVCAVARPGPGRAGYSIAGAAPLSRLAILAMRESRQSALVLAGTIC